MFIQTAAWGAAALSTGCLGKSAPFGSAGSAKTTRPNVLIVNIDDMGYGDMSCHGNPVFNTPNLDRLHGGSIRFEQFHAAPMCTPTRGQLLTGVDALRNGARWVGTENTHLRPDLPTMPEIFQQAGYRTGIFGKWHIGDNYPMRPQDRGFEEVVWFPQQEVGTVNDYWGNDYFDDTYEHNGERKPFKGYCTDVWFDLAMNWMSEKSDKDEPFFCYIPTNVVHGPYYVEDEYRDRVDIENLSPDIETFFGMLVNLDDNMGRLEKFLEEKGLRENTILIFMTDNGATGGYNTYNAGMRGLKTQLWEGGHRVPCFIRWPQGNLRQPGDIRELTQVQDLLPTLLDLCNIAKPESARFDGISLAQQLRGKEPMPDRILVVQFQRNLNIKKWDACIMWGPWRLLNARDVDPHDSEERKKEILARRHEIHLELYNVEDDPHQDVNVIGQHPDIVKTMKAAYEEYWARTEPDLAIERPIIIGNNAENPSFLAATAWARTYFTQIRNVLEGRRANGYWNVVVDQAGEYEFSLRRWPKEARTPLQGVANIKYTDPYVYGPKAAGKALPIKEARLKVGDFDSRKAVEENDQEVVFTTHLEPGPAQIKTWFYNEEGKMLCGAYYVYVRRK
jgi:arylsulfatase A-like enzyme